ncbi:MAG: hypothetical protein RLZZ204_1157 [Bacteroidota bacterium]
MKRILLLSINILFLFFYFPANAQEIRHSGWAMSLNTFTLNEKFTFFFDAQLRSNDNWVQSETFIFRPAIGYALNKNTILSLGVAAVTNWRVLAYTGPADEQIMVRDGVSDNRIWQQLMINKRYGNSSLQHRLRLEERGLGRLETDGKQINVIDRKFNARFRYFTRWIKPMQTTTNFQHGPYVALQNEFFLNMIGAGYANNKFFDQSRTFGGLGVRLSQACDIELGYMMQVVVPNNNVNIINHIAQLNTFVRL